MSMKPGVLKNIRLKAQMIGQKITSPLFMSKIYFRLLLGYHLDVKNPQTFNECLQYYKLYYCPNNPLVIQCTDKYAVVTCHVIRDPGHTHGAFLHDCKAEWRVSGASSWK